MGVSLHEDPLLDFLEEKHAETTTITPDTEPPGICVVGSGILRRNLRERLSSEGIPANNLARYATIEDIAERLLRAHHDEQPTTLESRFTLRLLERVLEQAESGSYSDLLEDFALSIPWEEEDVVEQLNEELNEYYRATDAGMDHDDLVAVASDHPDPFASETGVERAEVFSELHEAIEDHMGDFEPSVYLSRSHLVRAARIHVADYWDELYPDAEWLAFGTVSVLDNPTLRFTLQIQEDAGVDLHFFFEQGTRDYFETRLSNIVPELDPQGDGSLPSSEGAATLLRSVLGEATETDSPDDVNFVEAPDRRREIEWLVADLRQKFQAGIDPAEVLVVARDAGTYHSAVEDIFETNAIPYHVETRRPLAHAAAYRFLKAALDLLAAIEQDEPLTHWEVVDPLRLGWCPPDTRSDHWPVSDNAFLYLEEALHNLALRTGDSEPDEDPAITFEDWRDALVDFGGWEYPISLLNDFLDWVEEASSNPPEDGAGLAREIRNLELSHIYHTIPRTQDSPNGPGVQTGRTNLSKDHSTKLAQRVLSQGQTVAWHYDNVQEVLGVSSSWQEAATAVGQVIGTGTFGKTNDDARSVRFVDAGNANFLEAEYVYFLGMAVDQFPTEFSTPAFLPNQLREAVHQAGHGGDHPFLYLESRNDQYEQEVDLFEASLRICSGEPTILRPYKDSEGRDIQWSPFVDRLVATADDEDIADRVRMDDWLPQRADSESWHDTWDRISMKDRLRSYVYYSSQPQSAFANDLGADLVHDLASDIDTESLEAELQPRLDRYLRSPRTITVSADEPAFEGDVSLADIVGGPVRPHELDLFSQCELKYYFYQLLFAFEGDDVQRDAIPFYSSRRDHYRFGELPAVVRHNYTSHVHNRKVRTIVEELLPERQSDLAAFDSREELRDWFEDEETFTDWESRTLLRNLEAEWELVGQELANGIQREWTWAQTTDITIDDHEIRLPGHREDILPDGSDYRIPVYGVRNSHYGSEALKQCWSGPNQLETGRGYRHEDCARLCQSCSDFETCSRSTKYALDHRVHFSVAGIDSLAGMVFLERFSGSSDGREGMFKENHLDDVRDGLNGDPEAGLQEWPRPMWYARQGTWDDDLKDHLERMATEDSLSASVDTEFVEAGGCENCVYRELCHVPLQEERQ